MGRLALIDGTAFPPEQAKVSVYDRGFLYGDSVFETLRTYGGQLFAAHEHFARLAHSAAEVGITLPVSLGELAAEVERALGLAGNADSMVRIVISRGAGPLGLDPTLAPTPLRVVLVEPLRLPPAAHYQHGVRAACVQTVRASDAAEGAKVGNYLASALAHRLAKERGADEALIVDREGRVVESTTSNVFAVEGGALVTPALEAGILAGVTRALVLELARAEGLVVRFDRFTPEALAACEEVFLTSTIREILPVVAVDGRAVGTGQPGPVTRRLHLALRARVGLAAVAPPWAPA
ncbi:MAG: aminotransferase class IV [Myxococcales bacterium]|nr:aminotransferase class IV [Myxococcales bacterium]